ncbi:MAG: TA system antitoxin ParD family protein [Acidimicrobiales bacterium]
MATTSPTRIEDDLYASAKLAGDAQSRSASQQVAHWARIGREIQASASISHREIAEVLAGRRSYDGLDPKEQAIVRAEWAERMTAYREELDLVSRFTAAGRTWVELDSDGKVIERGPTTTKPGAVVRTTRSQRTTGPATGLGTKSRSTKGEKSGKAKAASAVTARGKVASDRPPRSRSGG